MNDFQNKERTNKMRKTTKRCVQLISVIGVTSVYSEHAQSMQCIKNIRREMSSHGMQHRPYATTYGPHTQEYQEKIDERKQQRANWAQMEHNIKLSEAMHTVHFPILQTQVDLSEFEKTKIPGIFLEDIKNFMTKFDELIDLNKECKPLRYYFEPRCYSGSVYRNSESAKHLASRWAWEIEAKYLMNKKNTISEINDAHIHLTKMHYAHDEMITWHPIWAKEGPSFHNLIFYMRAKSKSNDCNGFWEWPCSRSYAMEETASMDEENAHPQYKYQQQK